uniref:Uncharacterized protein n=1 Tax=Panagrolaimus sp. PS1159 TaxID=55785 RepID=A0AC35FV57_9BILA
EEEDGDEETATHRNLQDLAESIKTNRKSARRAAKKQADQMLEASNKRFATLKAGDNVRIPLPDVDRGKTDHRNIMGVVMEENNGLFFLS